MAPVEIFSNDLYPVGNLDRDEQTFEILSESLDVDPERGWYGIDTGIIRRRAQQLGVELNHDDTPQEILDEIEYIYFQQCIKYFQVSVNNPTWNNIVAAYELSLHGYSEDELQRENLRKETA